MLLSLVEVEDRDLHSHGLLGGPDLFLLLFGGDIFLFLFDIVHLITLGGEGTLFLQLKLVLRLQFLQVFLLLPDLSVLSLREVFELGGSHSALALFSSTLVSLLLEGLLELKVLGAG